MKKLVLLLFGLLFIFNQISAQHSGYMGKKFVFFAQTSSGIPHLSSASGRFRPVAHLHFGGGVDYIFRKRIAFGIKYKYTMASVLNNTNDFDRTLSTAQSYKKNKFRSHSISPHFKFYGKEAMAPLSMYIKLGLGFQILQQKDLLISSNSFIPDYTDKQVFDTKINFGLGKNFLIADLFLLGFEIETGIPLISHGRNFFSLNGFGPSDFDSTESIYRTNFASEILKISLNVGFLAF